MYVQALARELDHRGHAVAREVQVPVRYKSENVAIQRVDLIIDGKVVVEVKSTYELHKAAARQLFNYLRATELEVGLLSISDQRPGSIDWSLVRQRTIR